MTPAQRVVLLAGSPAARVGEHAPAAGQAEAAGRRRNDPGAVVSSTSFDELLSWAWQERLTGLLVHALDSGRLVVDGQVDAAEDCSTRARERHVDALRVSLAAEAAAVESTATLRRSGIDAYVFKGVANAHLDYPDPSWRTFNDADLHVRRDDFGRAIEVLLAHGFTRASEPMPGWWERRYARAAELRAPSGVEVDLHAAVATGYFGVVLDHDALRTDPVVIDLGGVEVHAFSAPARALISAYAVVLSRGPGLRLQRDLLELLEHLDEPAPSPLLDDPHGRVVITEAMHRLRLTVGTAAELAVGPPPTRPSGRSQRALALARRGETQGWSADARSSLLALSWTDRVAYVAGVAHGRSTRRWVRAIAHLGAGRLLSRGRRHPSRST